MLFVLAISLPACNFASKSNSNLSNEEKYAAKDVEQIFNLMKDPDSFQLNSDILYIEVVRKDSPVDYYTVIDYSGDNSFGTQIRDMAYFKNHNYLGNSDEPEEFDENDFNNKEDYLEALEKSADLAKAKFFSASWNIVAPFQTTPFQDGEDDNNNTYYLLDKSVFEKILSGK